MIRKQQIQAKAGVFLLQTKDGRSRQMVKAAVSAHIENGDPFPDDQPLRGADDMRKQRRVRLPMPDEKNSCSFSAPHLISLILAFIVFIIRYK